MYLKFFVVLILRLNCKSTLHLITSSTYNLASSGLNSDSRTSSNEFRSPILEPRTSITEYRTPKKESPFPLSKIHYKCIFVTRRSEISMYCAVAGFQRIVLTKDIRE